MRVQEARQFWVKVCNLIERGMGGFPVCMLLSLSLSSPANLPVSNPQSHPNYNFTNVEMLYDLVIKYVM